MPSSFGTTLRVSVFGQSHSPAIGCVVEGIPAGMRLDLDELVAFVGRRAPGRDDLGTPRREADLPRIVSGLNTRGETCGAPLAAVIENTNTRSGDYDNILAVPRPGHADYTAWAKWGGANDVPGGGHFSGRLTAPLCVAGGVALQWLRTQSVRVSAHVLELGGVADEPFSSLDLSPEARRRLRSQMDALADGRPLPTISAEAAGAMRGAVLAAREAGDTLGGIVEGVATGLPVGVGAPLFDGVENVLARALFAIPSVKGVDFGLGFDAARVRGSQDNDPFVVRDGAVTTTTNNAGGILGGITTGAPVRFRCAFKPISSIAIEQDSVDLTTMEPARLRVRGRHDVTAVLRAVPVVEATAALALADLMLSWPAERQDTD